MTSEDCRRRLQFRLACDPSALSVGSDPDAVTLPHTFTPDLMDAPTGQAPEGWFPFTARGSVSYVPDAPRALTATLTHGAGASWDLPAGGFVDAAAECTSLAQLFVSEVEAGPTGPDAGAEWVELEDAGFQTAFLAGWSLASHHNGLHPYTLAAGVALARGQRIVVTVPTQSMGNAADEGSLVAPHGEEIDRTPALLDSANDARTWQRLPEGAWAFRSGTPNAANA